MKRISLLAMSLIATASFAQTTLWDGDKVDGDFGDKPKPEIVENPEKDGINPSDKCFKIAMTQDNKEVRIPFGNWIKPGMNGSVRVSLMIRKKTPENVNLEVSDPTDGSGTYWYKMATWCDGGDKWQKLVFDYTPWPKFDNPGLVFITLQTGDVKEAEDVYIDNVQIEPATLVNGKLLSEIADGSLTGNVTLSGAWMKGNCANTGNNWENYAYDDFAALKAKLSATATSVDLRGSVLKDAYNPFGEVNSNIIVYTDTYFAGDNVVTNGTADKLSLNADHAFAAPEGFTAKEVAMYRPVYNGYSTLCLPFALTAHEIGAEALATYKGVSGETDKTVTFTTADKVEANTPMLVSSQNPLNDLTFGEKAIVATPATLATGEFTGTYAPQSATGLWGIGANNEFQKGGSEATIQAFGAYLNLPEAAAVKMNVTSGISNLTLSDDGALNVYTISGVKVSGVRTKADLGTLVKGIYIINNKKVIVK